MKITADDIRRQKFEIGFRGYNNQEVDTFLQLLADDYEVYMKDNDRLTKEVAELRKKVEEYKKKEEFFEKAMINAQRSANETLDFARKEAEKTMRDAELNSEKVIGRAEIKAMEIKDEIHELQKRKTQIVSHLKSMMEDVQKYIGSHGTDSEQDTPKVTPKKEQEKEKFIQKEKTEAKVTPKKIELDSKNDLSDLDSLLESTETTLDDDFNTKK